MIRSLGVHVVPGDGVVVRYGDIVAVIPQLAGPDEGAATSLIDAVKQAAKSADPVTRITAALGEMGSAAPAVGVVVVEDAGVSVLVRGDADLHVSSPGSSMHLSGRDLAEPIVRQLGDPLDRVVIGAGANPQVRSWLDLGEGVVPGIGATIRFTTVAPGAIAAPVNVEAGNPGELPLPPPPPTNAVPAFEAVLFDDVSLGADIDTDRNRDTDRDEPDAAPVRGALAIEAEPDGGAVEASPAGTEDPDGVQVQGLRCRRGHFNHPQAANCAWCGLAMVQDSYVLVAGPRPPLGVLLVNEQATFALDSDYIVGRSPERDERVLNHSARGLPLEDPDRSISRVHASIELRGWDVVAIDRASANGTWILEPGTSRWERLVPESPRPMRPGGFLQVGPHRIAYHSHHVR